MTEIIDKLIGSSISEELIVLIISALPIVELRGSLPVAINLFHMPWYWAFFLALVGNLLPVPILLLFFDSLIKIISKIAIGERLATLVLNHTRKRGSLIEKYERIGLILFVAIPLPVTGAWTGSIVAFLCGMRFDHAFLSIFCGLIIAGTIVTCLSLLGWIGAAIAGVILGVIAIFGFWKI